jgi:hypothetical protein
MERKELLFKPDERVTTIVHGFKEQLRDVLHAMRSVYNAEPNTQNPEEVRWMHENWDKAWRIMKERVPPLNEALRTEFQRILGVQDQMMQPKTRR